MPPIVQAAERRTRPYLGGTTGVGKDLQRMGRGIYNTSPVALLINLQLQTATPRSLVDSLHSLVDTPR